MAWWFIAREWPSKESGGQPQGHLHFCLHLEGHPTHGETGQGILIQPWKGSQGCLWGAGQHLGHSVRRPGIALCSATDKLCNLGQVPSPIWDSVSPLCVTMMSLSCQAISLADFMQTLFPPYTGSHTCVHNTRTHVHTYIEAHMCTHSAAQEHAHVCAHPREHRHTPLHSSGSYPVQVPSPAFLGLPVSPWSPAGLNLNGSPTHAKSPFIVFVMFGLPVLPYCFHVSAGIVNSVSSRFTVLSLDLS